MIHCATLCSTEANVSKHSTSDRKLLRQNLYNAKRLYADLPRQQLSVLRDLTATLHLSIIKSELLYLGGDTRFVELGRYLCEVRAGQYWRLESLKCFDEFLERRFPESRRKAYYLMSIHEHLPPQVRRELKEVGWTKGLELAKLARSRDGQEFDCATWLHKARVLPKEQF